MSLDEAWEHVKSWKKEGKISEAKRGCKEIIKFFPDHEAKDLLIEIEVEEDKNDWLELSEIIDKAINGGKEGITLCGNNE